MVVSLLWLHKNMSKATIWRPWTVSHRKHLATTKKYRVTKMRWQFVYQTRGWSFYCRKIIQLRRVSKGRKEFHFHAAWYKCYKSSLNVLATVAAPELMFLEKRGTFPWQRHSLCRGSLGRLPGPHTPTPTLDSHLLQEVFSTRHSEGHFAAGSDGVEPPEAPPPLAASSVGSRQADVEAQMSSFIHGRAKKSLHDASA